MIHQIIHRSAAAVAALALATGISGCSDADVASHVPLQRSPKCAPGLSIEAGLLGMEGAVSMKRTDFARRCAALSRLCAGWAADTLSCLDLDQDEGDQTVRRFIEDVRGRLEWIGNDLRADAAPVDGGSKAEPVARQWRFRAIGKRFGEWGVWREGPAPNLTSSNYEVEERSLYTAPPAHPDAYRHEQEIERYRRAGAEYMREAARMTVLRHAGFGAKELSVRIAALPLPGDKEP